ncbi:MAG TPA: sigma 54-interacting transcriptional regulator [Kofleriaceae bacterium]|nr:sigma 54-interacting transcriptional regulator [Kofleriaceae bacterium]
MEILKGAADGQSVDRELSLDRVVIGAHASCDVVVGDPSVAAHHCELVAEDGGWAVRDLASATGTFIRDVRVREVVIAEETRLRVGDVTLRVVPLDAVDVELSAGTSFGPLVGESPAMRRVFATLQRVAPSDSTVLITGESGTGKEVCARAIHEASARARKPLVVVDCGALPATLIESELFGHVRGAFTGAVRDRVGAFEAASGGTLFLDEIGELPLDLQTRLLGVLERRRVTPLGGTQPKPIDVRVIAATNRDLRAGVNEGTFRQDLYFRLAVVTVEMPPLRQRREDIRLYVERFLDELGARGTFTFDDDTLDRLERNPWHGNVRELRNVIERAAALGSGSIPSLREEQPALPKVATGVDVEVPFKTAKAALVDDFERAYCARLLEAHGGNITQAARAAELDRVYLLRVLDKHGLRPKR